MWEKNALVLKNRGATRTVWYKEQRTGERERNQGAKIHQKAVQESKLTRKNRSSSD